MTVGSSSVMSDAEEYYTLEWIKFLVLTHELTNDLLSIVLVLVTCNKLDILVLPTQPIKWGIESLELTYTCKLVSPKSEQTGPLKRQIVGCAISPIRIHATWDQFKKSLQRAKGVLTESSCR